MMRSHATQQNRRSGVILLVVITLLTLFAIVGLAFFLYSEGEARSSNAFRQFYDLPADELADIPPPTLAAFSIGQLVYDVEDPVYIAPGNAGNTRSASFSALRGHSLARSMYGWN